MDIPGLYDRLAAPQVSDLGVSTKACPKCPCGFPLLFHHAESSAFAQVSALQDSNGLPDVPVRPRLTAFRIVCELRIEV